MLVCAPTHDNLKAVETLVKEYDIRIAIHNHGPEDKHFPTRANGDVVHSLVQKRAARRRARYADASPARTPRI